jgi:hypothetical protein
MVKPDRITAKLLDHSLTDCYFGGVIELNGLKKLMRRLTTSDAIEHPDRSKSNLTQAGSSRRAKEWQRGGVAARIGYSVPLGLSDLNTNMQRVFGNSGGP